MAICTILVNGSCGRRQGSGSIQTHDWNRSRRKPPAMSWREPKCWMKKHVCGQGQRFLLPNRASRCWVALWGHVDFVRAQLEATTAHCFKQSRACPISSQHGLCCFHCASPRANCQLRVLRIDVVEQFARTHDARVWQCLCDILKIPEDFVGNLHKEAATLPLSLGGLGSRSAVRTSVPAHWASWAGRLAHP